MDFMLPFQPEKLPQQISYKEPILLIGSCFTEHISQRLKHHQFNTLSNPNGILFNPLSVINCLKNYCTGKTYTEHELFYLNETWNSWEHHSQWSDIDKKQTLQKINNAQQEAHLFIKKAGWVVITLGSAFQYYLKENNLPVHNNHRAPAQWFDKKMLSTDALITALEKSILTIKNLNPQIKFIFTVSPVRHIREGLVENNRSKARLIQAVHQLCDHYENVFYFPAYELIIDVLRDYRFYDIDMVHPNYAATQYVWEKFTTSCMTAETLDILRQVNEIMTAKKHRPRFPETHAHQNFMKETESRWQRLTAKYPFLNMKVNG